MNTEQLITALSLLPRLCYADWIRVISALSNELGAEQAHDILKQAGWKDEKRGETLYKCKHPLRNITMGTLRFILTQHNIKLEGHTKTCPVTKKRNTESSRPVSRRDPVTWRFHDDALEERAAILQFDGCVSRFEAEQKIFAQYPQAERDRAYRVAISTKSVNKELHCDWNEYIASFHNTTMTLSELQQHIQSGFAVAPSLFDGRKKSENWFGAELLFLDIDDGMSVEAAMEIDASKQLLFGYYTPSHTHTIPRYRLVFALSGFERNGEYVQHLLKRLIGKFSADSACSDLGRFYYGSKNTIFFTNENKIYDYQHS